MRDKLKRHYQIHREVSRSSYLRGEMAVTDMPRLVELLASLDASIEARFEFHKSEYNVPLLHGELQAHLGMACQRCLQVVTVPVQLEFKLLIDATDEVVQESSLDTIYSDSGDIDIFEVVEDELILALPLVAMHEHETCNKHWQDTDFEERPAVRENPFSVLKDLKIKH